MEKIIISLKQASENSIDSYKNFLLDCLNKNEKQAFEFTESLKFKDGAWYRPIHNIIVPLSMKKIIKENSVINHDLMYAAILHDIGYSKLNIKGTLEGADWENKRRAHMKAGEIMAKDFLSKKTYLSQERKKTICEIIGEHDNPYINKGFKNQESLYVRDADLTFVPSVVSFYKDYLAYKVNNRELSLENFLYQRLTNFYSTFDKIPKTIKQIINKKNFVKIEKENTYFESAKTFTGKEIINHFLELRAKEVFNKENQILNISFFNLILEKELNFFKHNI